MKEDRWARLRRLDGVGDDGIEKIRAAGAALVGCGTTGSVYALNLARLGIGYLRLIDRDIVEPQNLATQMLYDEEDVRRPVPKVVAAAARLAKIASDCRVEPHPSDLNPRNAEELLTGVDVIIDGTDNFETRFLINDVSLKSGIPWIYTGVVGFTGLTMTIVPGKTACLRCLMNEPPGNGALPTCETAGVWLPAAQAIAAEGLTQLLHLLSGRPVDPTLTEIDLSRGARREIRPDKKPDCPACSEGKFDFLSGIHSRQAVKLCGRDIVHLQPSRKMETNLAEIAATLGVSLPVTYTEHILKVTVPEAEIYLFSDGRALIKGITDAGRAKAIYHRYISP